MTLGREPYSLVRGRFLEQEIQPSRLIRLLSRPKTCGKNPLILFRYCGGFGKQNHRASVANPVREVGFIRRYLDRGNNMGTISVPYHDSGFLIVSTKSHGFSKLSL